MQETINYLNKLLKDEDTVVIGLSGGPDSMCLLDILLNLNKDLKIVCAHINHNIREESLNEALQVEEYCLAKKVIFETITFEKKDSENNYTEQELREKRYNYFKIIVDKYNAKYLFTAHHGDDLIETILMRITRGSNLKGYTGFLIETDKETYKIIKPLIFMTKNEIENYNREHNIPYVIDKSNNENKYTRNRYRHNILPFLKQENPKVHLKYLKFSNELYEYYNYVDKQLKEEINNRYNNKVLDLKDFNNLDKLIQRKIIEYILDEYYIDNLYLVSDKHVNIILNMIYNIKPNMTLKLPDKLLITKSYNKLIIGTQQETQNDYEIQIEKETILPNGHSITMIDNTEENSNYYIKLNSNEIKLPIYVRNRRQGDRITIKNMTYSKKIKDIFIDSKLPLEERNTQPIVVDSNNQILWLPGLKKSKFDKANSENYDIILWYN